MLSSGPISLARIHPLVLLLTVLVPALPALAQSQAAQDAADRRAMEAAGIRPDGNVNLPAPPSSSSTSGSNGPRGSNLLITYFPPVPPVYGGAVAELSPATFVSNGRALEASDEVADFVGETFYPALAGRLDDNSLPKQLQARLAAYSATRTALIDELMAELVRLQNATPAERTAALKTFAPQQDARLAALETEAEKMRRELAVDGFGRDGLDWLSARSWRLGAGSVVSGPLKAEAEFQVARGAAFFQDGPAIEQRGLLRELAIDLARTARIASRRRPGPDDDPAVMFFSPETARMRAPTPLPPDLTGKLGRYNSEKAALKRELMDVLIAAEKLSDRKRTDRFKTLAFEQAPRIAAQEKLAEEIREGLATLRDQPPPWVPPISPPLQERIQVYNRDRNALIAEFLAAQLRGAPARPRGDSPDERAPRQADAQRAIASEFENQHADRIDALHAAYDQIRGELAEVARGLEDPRTHQPLTVETMLDAYRVAMQRFAAIGREEVMYDRYKTAMLQPGLSPAQRRLLFRAAHASLAQPLPFGEASTPVFSRPMTAS